MRAIKSILILIMLITTVAANHPSEEVFVKVSPDIVMIDSGTSKDYSSDFLKMSKTCKTKCWHVHGDQMAKALEDEISGLNFNGEVNAVNLIWQDHTDIPRRIDEAAQMNPKVIIMAIAGEMPMGAEYDSIRRATSKGILVVAASGNQGGQSQPQFPAGYDLPCLIAVSTKEFGAKVESANLGEIYLERMSGEKGTSFSTARAGAIALRIFERYKGIECKMVKALMIRDFGSAQ